MPIDKYKQAFQEEAREVLTELESTLLELNTNPVDAELIGRAFRALHTIKGSGAMFGFDEISSFTHHVENAFDQVRSNRLAVSSDLISLSLAAVDQIKTMLEEAAGRGHAEASVSEQILKKLRALCGTEEPAEAKKVAEAAETKPVVSSSGSPKWHIRFNPKPEFVRNGSNPFVLLRELRKLGELKVTAQTENIPQLAELDPQRCYVLWDCTLETPATAEAIRDVFIFVEDCCELNIEPVVEEQAVVAVDATAAPVERRSSEGRRASDKETAASIRVAAVKLDQLVDLVGQLVTVQALRGSIEIASQPHVGSTVTLRLPLTLAIIDGLLVRVGGARFVLPLANTLECIELTRKDVEEADGKYLANIRGEIIPYIRLSEYLQMRTDRPEREQVMVAETEHGRFGFVVDQVLGDHQTVIKNLGALYRNVQIVSGATILGDGTVALILDVHRLAQAMISTTGGNGRARIPSPFSQTVA